MQILLFLYCESIQLNDTKAVFFVHIVCISYKIPALLVNESLRFAQENRSIS